ncbi:MAG: hypothetical protein JXA25_20805, partial [Anaerolineales bacterium]|nr:hypothetical protein [Anaerolineales bacterium]
MRRFFRAPEIILILLAIEGVFASFLVFDIPSMEKNAFLFGYSLERILTGGIIFVLAGLFLAAGLYLLKQPDHSLRLKNSISDRLKKDSNNLLNLSIALPAISLAAFSALMILYYTPVDPLWPSLPVVVDRALAAIIWAAAVPLHLWAALLAVQFTTGGHESLKRPGAGQIISMLVLFSLTVFQWFTLLLRSEWIREVGSWFRKYRFKGLRPSHLILLLLLILSVFVVRWLLRSTARGQVKVLVVFVLGVVLLAGYGFAEGPGFDFFTNEYLISEFQLETRWACEYPGSILDAVRNYEAHFGDTLWYGTKPPG